MGAADGEALGEGHCAGHFYRCYVRIEIRIDGKLSANMALYRANSAYILGLRNLPNIRTLVAFRGRCTIVDSNSETSNL
eukprot:7738584-Pyramimonas_sp.AAC.1